MKRLGILVTIWLFIGCWLIISIVASFGMYRLWWQRERVLYSGKNTEQQREIVFQRSGLPVAIISKLNSLSAEWPPEINYSAVGDNNALSYVKYLLIPRVPSGNERYSLQVKNDNLTYTHTDYRSQKHNAENTSAKPIGLLLSLFFVLGTGALFRNTLKFKLTWPEAFALSCFLLTGIVYFTKLISNSVFPAFYVIAILGIIGWCVVLLRNHYHVSGFGSRLIKLRKRFHEWISEHGVSARIFIISLVGIIALNIFWCFIMSVIVVPDDWDAWAMWGAKAKMLALGQGSLFDVTYFGHADYPLLWPVVWAFSGWCAGGWEEHWSRGWGAVFLFFALWEQYLIVINQTRNTILAFLSGALFVSVPMVPLIASWSYAEAPLWLYILCSLACFFRWHDHNDKLDIIFVSIFAAGAAWTKNEGLLFAFLLACFFVLAKPRRLYPLFLFLCVLVVCYLPWLVWSRVVHDLGAHALAGLSWHYEIILHAVTRLGNALEAIKNMWLDVRQWSIVGCAVGISWLFLLFSPSTKNRGLLLIPVFMLLVFLIIMLFQPDEIYWQVGTSWNRLTVQSLPLFFVTIFPELWRLWSKYQDIR